MMIDSWERSRCLQQAALLLSRVYRAAYHVLWRIILLLAVWCEWVSPNVHEKDRRMAQFNIQDT